VNVRSQPHVIGKVPADVIGIVVDDDFVGVPEPAIAEANIVWGNAKKEPAKPETPRTATSEAPAMAGAEAAREVSVLPRVIDMVMRIILAGVVPDPLITFIDVRNVRVAGLVTVIPLFLAGMRVGGAACSVPFSSCSPPFCPKAASEITSNATRSPMYFFMFSSVG